LICLQCEEKKRGGRLNEGSFLIEGKRDVHQTRCSPVMSDVNKCSELDAHVEWAEYAYCERDGIAHVPAAEIAVDVDADGAAAAAAVVVAVAVDFVVAAVARLAAAAVAAACYIDILALDTARRHTPVALAFLKYSVKAEF
jgi:hypothetical protein